MRGWPRSALRAAATRRRSRVHPGTAAPKIDFADIPEASNVQFRMMRRVGRRPIGDRTRQLIAIRLDPDVLKRLRKEAKRRNVGYQTLINRVLADYVSRHVA